MNLAHLMHRAAALQGERPCLALDTEVRYSYAEASHAVAALASGLVDRLKLEPGSRVALFMPNNPEYLLVLFAVWHAGLVAVPINAKLHPKELSWILEDCAASVLFTTDKPAAAATEASTLRTVIEITSPQWQALLKSEARAAADVGANDLAWIFYTSGTTGRPKGAMLSHANLLAMTAGYFADVDTVSPEDCMIHCAPLSHGSGLYALPHVARGAAHIIPASSGFEAKETVHLIQHWPRCSLFFAPTLVRRLVEALDCGDSTEVANLKTIIYGGGPMYVEDLQRALGVLGPKLAQIYGQGEAPMSITSLTKALHVDHGHPQHLRRLASVGLPQTSIEVRVVQDGERPLPAGAVGEVIARGPVVMSGYWRNEPASAQTLRNGWLHTGDLGSFDEHGFLTLVGRSKEVVISGGNNIYPREVEDVLLLHPDVAEAAVVGRPHPEWGEELVAFIAPRAHATVEASALDRVCLEHLARYKRPKHYVFVTTLPKNNYGKVLKTALIRSIAHVADDCGGEP